MNTKRTTQTINTRIGKLTFENGYPTRETTEKLFEELDFQRAVQAFLWAFPAVSFESIRIGVKQDLGIDYAESFSSCPPVIPDKFPMKATTSCGPR